MPLPPDHAPRPANSHAILASWIAGPALVLASLALFIALDDRNVALFRVWNEAAAGWLPPALWAGITNLGATLGAFCLIAPALAWRPQWVAATLLAAPFAATFAQGLKYAYAEPRPAAVLPLDSFNVIGLPLRTDSFPSGHSTTAFVVAGVLALCTLREWRRAPALLALALACLVAYSRVAVGAHWPLDIFTGAAGGWLAAAIGVGLSDRLRFWEQPRGVRAMAGLLAVLAIAFAIEDVGYPEGVWSQYLLVAWALGGIAFVLLRPAPRSLA
ncbi:hypothetical protein dqs_2292 [Azoarcus olearius]|uniref:phosphatase PAP2 family protein n=1 Tax=Azoarcus sp. (strain BH72) TaxID=418699 RepID=UPI0008064402|nr:phosphatase PAP2 family protein [Azoarcus olearius]ANQ85323.1 hypothetical protein dqs_2292 [Azoarcus olearius]